MVEQQRQLTRNTAYKVWIHDIYTAMPVVDVDSGMPYLPIKDKKVVRCNIFGTVVDEDERQGYSSVEVDDGSGSIRLKVWNDDAHLVDSLEVGDMVFVIGRYAEFNDERYIRPEIIRVVNIDWALLRRLELTKEYGAPSKEERIIASEVVSDEPAVEPSRAARERILTAIEKHEEVDDAGLVAACGLTREIVMAAVLELLKEGEIFSPKPGFYRLL